MLRLRTKSGPAAQLPGAAPRPNAKSKNWLFFSRTDEVPKKTEDVVFLVYQVEHHPHTGKHYQGYAEFSRKLRGSEAASALGLPTYPRNTKVPLNSEGKYANYGLKIRLGSQSQAIRYCSSSWYCRVCHSGDALGYNSVALACSDGCHEADTKYRVSETVVIGQPGEDVTFHAAQVAIVSDVKAGKRKREVYEAYPNFARPFWRWIDRQYELYQPQRDFAPGVYWLHGTSGSGKSRVAKAVSTDSYFKGPDSKWFDGYDGHSTVVINDIRKSTFSFSYLLELFDRYPLRVETKGGSVQLLNKVFIVTCSKPPDELWADIAGTTNENVDQLIRRMTRVVAFPIDAEAKKALVRLMRIHVEHGSPTEHDNELGTWTPGDVIPGEEGGDADQAAGPVPAVLNMALDAREFPAPEEASEAETLVLGMNSLTL